MKIQNLMLVVIYFGFVIACNAKPKWQDKVDTDPRFANDYIKTEQLDFPFNPKELPEIGKTNIATLNKRYPKGPAKSWTYLKPFPKTIRNKTFKVDRLLRYNRIINTPVKGSNYTGFDGKERLYLVIFFHKNIVSHYIIIHKVIGDDDQWEEGKFNTFKEDPNDSNLWTNSSQDADRYWNQRSLEDRFYHMPYDLTKEEREILRKRYNKK